jgi:hypothetical protein
MKKIISKILIFLKEKRAKRNTTYNLFDSSDKKVMCEKCKNVTFKCISRKGKWAKMQCAKCKNPYSDDKKETIARPTQ